MIGFGWSERKILDGGYYKAHRYWSMLREARADQLMDIAVILLMPHTTDQARKESFDNLKARQPRRHPPEDVPHRMVEKFQNFKAKWDELDRKQKAMTDAGSEPKTASRN